MASAQSKRYWDRQVRDHFGDPSKRRGLLVAFEGPDGSGKTTQRKLLKNWLKAFGEYHKVVTTKWNSSELLKPVIKARKDIRVLSPEEFSLLHAADFRHRVEQEVLPALWRGHLVIADRFLYTGLARDVARGLDLDWVLKLYQPLVWPDLVLYFSVSPRTSTDRVTAARLPNFYESGQDITDLDDPTESYLRFITRIIGEYEALATIFNFTTVNAEQAINEQHQEVRRLFREREQRPWSDWNLEAYAEWLAQLRGIGVAMARRPAKGRLLAVDGLEADTVKGTARTVSTECRPRAGVSHGGASGIFDDIAAGDPGAGRPSARTLLLLYAADLAFRLRWEIGPALEEGRSVVVAPYVDTAIAVGRAAGLPRAWLVDLFSFAPKPSERRVVTVRADETSLGRARGFVDLACRSVAGSTTPDEFARSVGRHLTPRRR